MSSSQFFENAGWLMFCLSVLMLFYVNHMWAKAMKKSAEEWKKLFDHMNNEWCKLATKLIDEERLFHENLATAANKYKTAAILNKKETVN